MHTASLKGQATIDQRRNTVKTFAHAPGLDQWSGSAAGGSLGFGMLSC